MQWEKGHRPPLKAWQLPVQVPHLFVPFHILLSTHLLLLAPWSRLQAGLIVLTAMNNSEESSLGIPMIFHLITKSGRGSSDHELGEGSCTAAPIRTIPPPYRQPPTASASCSRQRPAGNRQQNSSHKTNPVHGLHNPLCICTMNTRKIPVSSSELTSGCCITTLKSSASAFLFLFILFFLFSWIMAAFFRRLRIWALPCCFFFVFLWCALTHQGDNNKSLCKWLYNHAHKIVSWDVLSAIHSVLYFFLSCQWLFGTFKAH